MRDLPEERAGETVGAQNAEGKQELAIALAISKAFDNSMSFYIGSQVCQPAALRCGTKLVDGIS